MKLNKPPVNEEKSALEDYFDFLLNDVSNVTPIHAKKATITKSVNLSSEAETANNTVAENTKSTNKNAETLSELIAEIDLKPANQQLNSQENVFTYKEDLKVEVAKNEQRDDSLNSQSTALKNNEAKQNKNNINPEIPVESSGQETLSTELRPVFVAESEADELKKWDAILTQEKEQQILALETEDINKSTIKSRQAAEPVKKTQEKKSSIAEQSLPLKEPDERLANVERLLARISLATKPSSEIAEEFQDDLSQENEVVVDDENEISQESAQATFVLRESTKTKDILPDVFQTLIFNVGKLPLAVPLLKLGGIVHMSVEQDITPLVGTPDWFMGLVPNERGNLMVIDTQKYLMPEQSSASTENTCGNKGNYEYLILLDDSNWALACHSVGDAKNLTLNDIRWSEKSSSRPWFGGMVVEYMSALVEVDELINMLASNIVD